LNSKALIQTKTKNDEKPKKDFGSQNIIDLNKNLFGLQKNSKMYRSRQINNPSLILQKKFISILTKNTKKNSIYVNL
jgi:hypothetical protein